MSEIIFYLIILLGEDYKVDKMDKLQLSDSVGILALSARMVVKTCGILASPPGMGLHRPRWKAMS